MTEILQVAINGAAGRMGAAVARALAATDGAALAAAFERADSSALGAAVDGATVQSLADADPAKFEVLIDFSRPAGALAAAELCASAGRALVVGTTGLSDEQAARMHELSAKAPIVAAPNMSVGVNICFALLKRLAELCDGLRPEIDIIEAHHRGKADAPSGTALKMGELLAPAAADDDRPPTPATLRDRGVAYHALRAADQVGEHAALIALPGERIDITHRAFGRDNFAHGAVRAALWVRDKPPGLYTMTDVLGL